MDAATIIEAGSKPKSPSLVVDQAAGKSSIADIFKGLLSELSVAITNEKPAKTTIEPDKNELGSDSNLPIILNNQPILIPITSSVPAGEKIGEGLKFSPLASPSGIEQPSVLTPAANVSTPTLISSPETGNDAFTQEFSASAATAQSQDLPLNTTAKPAQILPSAAANPVTPDATAVKISHTAETKVVSEILKKETKPSDKSAPDTRGKLTITQTPTSAHASPENSLSPKQSNNADVSVDTKQLAADDLTTSANQASFTPEQAKPTTPEKLTTQLESGFTKPEAVSSTVQPNPANSVASTSNLRHLAPAVPAFEQVAMHVARANRESIDHIRIQMDPAQLGRIDVRLEIGHDGRIIALMAVDRPETLDLLQRDAKALERSLQDAGLKTNSDSLNFSLRQQTSGERHPGFESNSHSNSSYQGSSSESELSANSQIELTSVLQNKSTKGHLDISV